MKEGKERQGEHPHQFWIQKGDANLFHVLFGCFLPSLSLHAQLQDGVTCAVIANIWLKNPSNFRAAVGYRSLAEMYVVRVLCVAHRWNDVRPFLDSCPGFTESVRDSIAKQVTAYRHKLEQSEVNWIEVLESDGTHCENTDANSMDSTVGHIQVVGGN